MALIVAIAVAFAALRNANTWWAGGVLLLTLGLLGYAILASINGRRAWLGFLVACGGYFVAVRTLPEQEIGWLPASQAITYIQLRVPGVMTITTSYAPTGATARARILLTSTNMTMSANSMTITGNAPVASSRIPWGTLLPGAANSQEFRSIGQNLFALIFGWLGALVSRRMYRPISEPQPES